MAELLSNRLFALLSREVARLEACGKEFNPKSEAVDQNEETARRSGDGRASEAGGSAARAAASGGTKIGFKERADVLSLLTRTLEKLLELRGREARDGDADDSEVQRLRDDFMRRLRALDARRPGGSRLFDGDGNYALDAAAARLLADFESEAAEDGTLDTAEPGGDGDRRSFDGSQ
ncbi:hypothetical protein LQ948_04500 [Jiella sp. MQZ9-1]|uniref:Uncharacterized protein n=1 Tax=Jiella flava TaxID=2816857 RepID=A0A939FVW4_9HYPH|nr:hypothetical protein [Jiella flava]MBO0661824.1 hypothetical protein [Jiella flava]MCD2470464.1 hypothetical protein [Jiella flava]